MPLVHEGKPVFEHADSEAHARARKIRPELTRGELFRVAGGRNQAEAELIQNILLEEGVPSILRRTAGFDVPDFLAAGPRDVLVPASAAAVARAALAEEDLAEQPPSAARQPRPLGRQAAIVLAAIVLGAAVAASIAWLLLQAVG
jgi:hypothetical protein